MNVGAARSKRIRVAIIVLLLVPLLVAAGALYILFVPIDPSNFASATGVDWSDFSSVNPEASDYLNREARVLAVGYLGLGLVAALLVWGPLRAREPWAVPPLWLLAMVLLAASFVFFAAGDAVLGTTYLAVGLVSAAAMAVVRRSLALDSE